MGSQAISPTFDADSRRVLDALRWIFRDLRLAQNPEGQGRGPSAAQLFVLHVLREAGPLSVGELAVRTATDPSSVSVVVRKLHRQGLVAKAHSPGDRRRLEVSLTPAGARAAALSPVPVQQRLLDAMGGLEAGDLRALAGLLERIAPPAGDGHPAPMFFQEGASGGRP